MEWEKVAAKFYPAFHPGRLFVRPCCMTFFEVKVVKWIKDCSSVSPLGLKRASTYTVPAFTVEMFRPHDNLLIVYPVRP